MDEELNTGNNSADTSDKADILSQILSNQSEVSKQTKLLASIDASMKKMLMNSNNISASKASSSKDSHNTFRSNYKENIFGGSGYSGGGNRLKDFKSAFEKELIDGLFTSNLKSAVQGGFKTLAADLGVSINEIGSGLGKAYAQKLIDKLKNTKADGSDGAIKSMYDALNSKITNFTDKIKTAYNRGYSDVVNGGAIEKELNDYIKAHKDDAVKLTDDDIQAEYNRIRSRYVVNHPAYKESEKSEQQEANESATKSVGNNENKSQNTGPDKSDKSSSELSASSLTIYADVVNVNNKAESVSDTAEKIADSVSDSASKVESDSSLADTVSEVVKGKSDDTAAEVAKAGADALGAGGKAGELAEVGANVLGAGGEVGEAANLIAGADSVAGALGGISSVAGMAGPAVVGVTLALDALTPAIEATKDAFKELEKISDRFDASQKKNIDLAQKRLESDVEAMIKAPFEIMEKAANEWYNTWNNNLRTINGTQGYNKEEFQALMGAYAERLRRENLTSVVSASDITNNLAKVLEAGLSGTVAEEFAYLATELNAAVPTQDFFSYAGVYSSIAANAVRQGESESKAIHIANEELKAFANNLLYASREISGGFSTGLKDAQSLFEKSVQISQTAKTNDASEISGVLTAVSAITGAIAPDLASSMTDAIYKAAVGGNSSEIVALRSLAGINASNTEFLRELAANPKAVFVNLFTELANRQSMSQDAYMEVAEGLSNIFGVSMDAFARVDFAYLAKAIESMDTSSIALTENLLLLQSGETTTNAEQLKMQQINKIILDEGLAYVIDNETAQLVQQHMWDEQMNRELMEATYGVELHGAGLKFLEGIRGAVDNVMSFLNPLRLFGIMDKVDNITASEKDSDALRADIENLLEAGKVGTGTELAMKQLTTRNENLYLTDSIVNMLGGTSEYAKATSSFFRRMDTGSHFGGNSVKSDMFYSGLYSDSVDYEFSGKSRYDWNTIGKTVAQTIADSAINSPALNGVVGVGYLGVDANAQEQSATEAAQKKTTENLNSMIQSMKDYVNNNQDKGFEDWVNTAKNFGIADFTQAIENAGMTRESLQANFDTLQTQIGAQEKLEREMREEEFWKNNTELLTETVDWLETINGSVESILDTFNDYFSAWSDYYIDHTVYNSSFTHETYDEIARKEREGSETAIYALADALTQNDVKLLLDPTVQTNALLSQLLKVAQAILQQTQSSDSPFSLSDTFAGMSLGIID